MGICAFWSARLPCSVLVGHAHLHGSWHNLNVVPDDPAPLVGTPDVKCNQRMSKSGAAICSGRPPVDDDVRNDKG